MPASVSTLWYVDAPDPAAVLRTARPDCGAAQRLLQRLFPEQNADPVGRVSLRRAAGGSDDADGGAAQVFVGSYPGVTVVCSRDLMFRRPSTLPERWIHTLASEQTYLVVSDPPGAWGAFGAWERGTLRRSFGASPVEFFEDEGIPFVWERPFWAGDHPISWPAHIAPHPQALPFHPRRLVDTANAAFLGYRYVGRTDGELDPDDVEVWGFALRSQDEPDPPPSGTAPVRHRWWRRARRP
ncbi:DUF6928 family protein [Rhodococcus chondri]|uniref:Uncharacterized protein n=1 Tax=Rhodococcus chondri TaxID=3065941 RepID=A0ABU7JT65_9NOCA|nr:hypothetical protein [Rhodococcus sp. CC-R104]MEE2033212.1 hypothetical protein [Rhodococcus sp. CC-R104]